MREDRPDRKQDTRALVALIAAAQDAARMTNSAAARKIKTTQGTISRYRSGGAEPSLGAAVAWAQAVGARLTIWRAEHVQLGQLIEELTEGELRELVTVATALLRARNSPVERAVVLACIEMMRNQAKK